MSLKEARARYYANQFESESESSDEDWSEHFEESSSEEYIAPPPKSIVVDPKDEAREKLRQRLLKIRTNFNKAAPSNMGDDFAEFIRKKLKVREESEEESDSDDMPELENSSEEPRELASPIQEVRVPLTINGPGIIVSNNPIKFDETFNFNVAVGYSALAECVADCANVAGDIVPARLTMEDDHTEIDYKKVIIYTDPMEFNVPMSSDEIRQKMQECNIAAVEEPISMDVVDNAFGVPSKDDFNEWVVNEFGSENVPTHFVPTPTCKEEHYDPEEEAHYSNEESWGEWPECESWPIATDEPESESESEDDNVKPNPMDMKGNRIAKKLAGLQAELRKIEENRNVLIVEKENLMSQLKACKKRVNELDGEVESTLEEIEIANEEQTAHIEEMDELHSLKERKKRENEMISEIKHYVDDFSQAIQILLSSGKYCDIEYLIRSHLKDAVYLTDDVKESIIREAKVFKRDQLYATLEADNCYIAPKNEDGLPNLFDQYITDSYNIVEE
jgi:hypothetical protein